MACDQCTEQALGVLAQTTYTTRFPGAGCLEKAERIYCVNGELSVPPPTCVRVFGDTSHRFNSFTNGQEAALGSIPISGTDITVETSHGETGRRDLTVVTNDSCYPMELVYFESDTMTYAVDDPNNDQTSRFNAGFAITRDNVRVIKAGGITNAIGDGDDPIDADSSGFTFIDPTLLMPGVSCEIRVALITSAQSVGPLCRIIAFGSAVRIIGFPQC